MYVSVTIPAYDEVTNLAHVVDEARAVLGALGHADDGEVLIVEDGSRDGTAAVADDLARKHANVRVVHHETNRGFCGAMTTCFREALGDWVFLAPADGQTPIATLGPFLDRSRDADIVIGVRASRPDAAYRKLLSRAFHVLARVAFELPYEEFSSAFLFRRSLLDQMPFRSRPRSATLLPEILFRARSRGARMETLVVPQLPRRSGRAKGGQLSVAVLTFLEMARLAPLVRLDELRKVRRVAAR